MSFKLIRKMILYLDEKKIITVDDTTFLKIKYRHRVGRKLNLENPQTFNEKLQWLKIHDRKDIYTTLADKHEVKKFVGDKIGKKFIIQSLGIYDKFEDIDFNKLPSRFVIKCTHDSGGYVICKDKNTFDVKNAQEKINSALKKNYFRYGREWPYKNIKPRILVEEYMEDSQTHELRDYKFFCFRGKVHCFKIDFNRSTNHRANYYSKTGKLLMFGEKAYPPDNNKKLQLPKKLDEMIKLAERLSKDFAFIRIDFYEVDGRVYFGEITFYPASGFGSFTDEAWDYKLGNLIDLTLVRKEENA